MELTSADETRLLAFKPEIPYITDEQWLLVAEIDGIPLALVRYFWHWLDVEIQERRMPHEYPNDIAEWGTVLGEVGFRAYVLCNSIDGLVRLLTAKRWDYRDLGIFGEWAQRAGCLDHLDECLIVLAHDLAISYKSG